MHLARLTIRNFRAIESIEVEFTSRVSVIIGPNAVGKTTILEAIRFAKAVLSPRTQNEANQTLIYLGVMSPHMQQRLFPSAIARTPTEPTVVRATFKLHDTEIDVLTAALPRLPFQLAQQNSGIIFNSQSQLTAFFSSAQGQEAVRAAQDAVSREYGFVQERKTLRLNLTIDWASGAILGEYPLDHLFYSAFEQSLDPSKTIFSYFPADRAMPVGEQPVQLGVADTSAQLESYNSQPQTKYTRLKHTIFSSIVKDRAGRDSIEKDFGLIFDRILKGRSLAEIGINEFGLLSIKVRDNETGRTFDIDALSSGEKGLILSFLLMARSLADNGLVLFDEPELHLNPAVSRDVLSHLVEEYAVKHNMQAIICSHSAEILAGAFENKECVLYHLRDGTTLAVVRQQDQGELRDALRRLGSSESEALLYKGTVSVEGIHDAEVLQAGFDELFRRYRFRERGGRGEIERSIKALQAAEGRGDIGSHYFIFDHDRKPTNLTNSSQVRFLQLDRLCLEN